MIKGLFAVLVVLLMASSCQEDSVSEKTEALNHDSAVTKILMSIVANETIVGDIVDNSSCFSIKLPVQVIANNIEMAVMNDGDYDKIETIFKQSSLDNDVVVLVFPLTVVYSDYKEISVNNQQEYNALVKACSGVPEYAATGCVSIVFPVTIYVYDSGYKMENPYVVNNNEELFTTLQNRRANEYYSLDYPITLNVSEGDQIVATSNDEFLKVVTNALEGCKEGGCTNPGILVDDLLVYIPFSNGVIKDLKDNIVNYSSHVPFVTDRSGNKNCAIAFNGTQFLHIPINDRNGIVQGDAFSVSLWFMMQNVNYNDLENLFTKGNTGEEGFELSIFNLNAPLFKVGSVSVKDIEWISSATLPVDIENWHHLVVTVDASNTIKLYRDGQLRNSIESSTAQIGAETMDYYIGKNFQGFMDDLRVYKKTLSPQEVQVLFELEGDCNTCLE